MKFTKMSIIGMIIVLCILMAQTVMAAEIPGVRARMQKNSDGSVTWYVEDKEVTFEEYRAVTQGKVMTDGYWMTQDELDSYIKNKTDELQKFADETLFDETYDSMLKDALESGKEWFILTANGTNRYFIDVQIGVREVGQEEYDYYMENVATHIIYNGVRLTKKEYEAVTGVFTSDSTFGRDTSKINWSTYHRPDVTFSVAYDLPWYEHQQNMYVGNNYSFGSLRSSKPLIEEIPMDEKLGMVPYKLVYEVGTILNFSYYREQGVDGVYPAWQVLESWDSYWTDRLDYEMIVIVDTAFKASASRIAWGHEVTLTEDMVGKRLGLWLIGESFDNENMVTIEIEVVPASTVQSQQSTPPTTVTFNNQPLQFDLPIINREGRTYYPLRQLIEGIGGTVAWDGETQKASGMLNGNEVNFFINSNEYIVNGAPATMDAIPFIENERTYIPIRFAAEALGLTVEWDTQTQTIKLTL